MKTALFVVAAMTIALLSLETNASKEFVALIPNGGNVANAPAIGHSDNTGKSSATNAFGQAFADAGKSWTSGLCQANTDGDGQTNGQELGDPCCEWTAGSTPRWTSGVSHPSDASKTSNESLWVSINCTGVTTVSNSAATSSAPLVGVALAVCRDCAELRVDRARRITRLKSRIHCIPQYRTEHCSQVASPDNLKRVQLQ